MKPINSKIRTLTLVIMIAMLSGTYALAQPGGQQGPPKIPGEKEINSNVKKLAKAIDLEDEQKIKVLKIYLSHFETLEVKTKEKTFTRAEMEKMDKKLETEVRTILTKDQQKKYTKYLKKQIQQRPDRPQGGPQGGGQRPPR
ncbi:MAG: hypothetical protein PF450_14240 [Bacteroidales bacterium]|jgi:hypothetical protein|nr:hypothetical protein [Bacteroidales bacterium]